MALQPLKAYANRAQLYLKDRWSKLFRPEDSAPVEQIHTKRLARLSAEKQAKLEELCTQLFKQKELITSGKLQLIGLQKIKKRMGKQWEGLSKIVYETTEDVIDSHLGKGDIFIRYKDDSYVMIFAHATPEEGRLRAAIIAKEIQERLFALDEEELRDIEIRQAISEIRTDMFMEAGFLDDMDGAMNLMFDDLEDNPEIIEDDNSDPLADVEALEIDTDARSASKQKFSGTEASTVPAQIPVIYIPLWDTKRGALTTYLCLARSEKQSSNFFDAQLALYKGKNREQITSIDISVLEAVGKELDSKAQDKQKFFIICPVNHETVYHMESYEVYKKALAKLPLENRKYLLLFVMNVGDTQPPKNAYWFAKPLRTLCPHLFAEIPLRRDVNFTYLRESGVDVAGVRLNKDQMPEPEIIPLLNAMSAKAKAAKISKTFVFDVSSLSITTSAVCAGFDFLGGAAIHGPVEKPDSIHRYHHADLIKQLSSK